MKEIGAIVGVAVAGILVGAVIAEVIRRRPDILKNLGASTKKQLSMIGAAFKEGYRAEKTDTEAGA